MSVHWEGIFRIRFSDDGEHLPYQAQEKMRTALILDRVEIDAVAKEYTGYLAEFIPRSAAVVAWLPDQKTKCRTVTFTGRLTSASFDQPGGLPWDDIARSVLGYSRNGRS